MINYIDGAPSSFFSIYGTQFYPNARAKLWINGKLLDEFQVNADGEFTIVLDSVGIPIDRYDVVIEILDDPSLARVLLPASAPKVSFVLDPSAPLRKQEDDVAVLSVKQAILWTIYLPLISQ